MEQGVTPPYKRVINLSLRSNTMKMKKSAVNNYTGLIGVKGDKLEYMVISKK